MIEGFERAKRIYNKAQEIELFKLFAEGDVEAKKKIIENNIPFVTFIAKRYMKMSNIESDDLVSIGTMGLIRAVESFDYKKEVCFSTYASTCIRNSILMEFRRENKGRKNISLSAPVFNKEDCQLLYEDIIVSPENVEEKGIINGDIYEIEKIMKNTLNDREKYIIKRRYMEEDSVGQEEVADDLELSRSYVSRLEKKAIEKIQSEFNSRVK